MYDDVAQMWFNRLLYEEAADAREQLWRIYTLLRRVGLFISFFFLLFMKRERERAGAGRMSGCAIHTY